MKAALLKWFYCFGLRSNTLTPLFLCFLPLFSLLPPFWRIHFTGFVLLTEAIPLPQSLSVGMKSILLILGEVRGWCPVLNQYIQNLGSAPNSTSTRCGTCLSPQHPELRQGDHGDQFKYYPVSLSLSYVRLEQEKQWKMLDERGALCLCPYSLKDN